MGYQTKINESNGLPKPESKGLARDVGELAQGALTLAELQVQLLVADVQECGQRALVPGLMLLGGMSLGLGCIPLALAALALGLVQVFELSLAVGFLLAVVAGAAMSTLLCVIGWFQIRKHSAILERSQQEFVRNLGWVKKMLKRSLPRER